MVWEPLPLNSTVLLAAVKAAPVPESEPAVFKVDVAPLRVPAVMVTLPEKVCVKLDPKFRVPPLPFMVSDAQVMLPVKVAVLEVRVNEHAPVVVNAAILGVALVPPMVIGDALAVNVPDLEKLPFQVTV